MLAAQGFKRRCISTSSLIITFQKTAATNYHNQNYSIMIEKNMLNNHQL